MSNSQQLIKNFKEELFKTIYESCWIIKNKGEYCGDITEFYINNDNEIYTKIVGIIRESIKAGLFDDEVLNRMTNSNSLIDLFCEECEYKCFNAENCPRRE